MITDASPDSSARRAATPTTQTHYDTHILGGESIVPYVARWTGEQTLPSRVIERARTGIAYADETVTDRDHDGVLWTRITSRIGQGRPLYRQMHSLRQRRAMRKLLCQVCAQPADYTDQGHLWLLLGSCLESDGWPDRIINHHPPVCLDCAQLSTRLCPALRRGYVAVRAHSTPYGVIGVQFQATQPSPAVRIAHNDDDSPVAYTDPVLKWTQAVHLTQALHGCTLVDIDPGPEGHGHRSGS